MSSWKKLNPVGLLCFATLLVGCGSTTQLADMNDPFPTDSETDTDRSPAIQPTPTTTATPNPEPSTRKDDTAALFLGLGPHRENSIPGYGCVGLDWTKWGDGSSVKIRPSSTTLSAEDIQSLQDAVGTVSTVTGGRVTAYVETTTEAAPQPNDGEVTAYSVNDPLNEGCAYDQGCAIANFAPFTSRIISGRFVVVTSHSSQAVVHDVIGHLVLALCHINATAAAAGESLMSFGPGFTADQLPFNLSSRDEHSISPVYASALNWGATAWDFAQIGLIDSALVVPASTTPQDQPLVRVLPAHAR